MLRRRVLACAYVWVLGLPTAVILVIIAGIWTWEKITGGGTEEEYVSYDERYRRAEEKRKAFEASLIGMIVMWIKARKAQICPLIDFEDDTTPPTPRPTPHPDHGRGWVPPSDEELDEDAELDVVEEVDAADDEENQS